MNRGLIGAITDQAVRTGSKYAVLVIGTVIDLGFQVAQGENVVDAGVKAVAHTGISLASGVGVAANMAFDWVYDNKDKIIDGAKKRFKTSVML